MFTAKAAVRWSRGGPGEGGSRGCCRKRQRGRQVGVLRLTPCSLLFPRAPSTFLVLPALSSPPPPLYHVASQALVCPVLTGSLWAPQDRWRGNKRLGEAGIPGERGPRVCHQVALRAQDNPGAALQAGGERDGSLRIRPFKLCTHPPATRGPPVISLLAGVCLSQGHSCTKKSKPNRAMAHGEHAQRLRSDATFVLQILRITSSLAGARRGH